MEAPDPSDLVRVVDQAAPGDLVLVDDLATWLTNAIDDAVSLREEVSRMLHAMLIALGEPRIDR